MRFQNIMKSSNCILFGSAVLLLVSVSCTKNNETKESPSAKKENEKTVRMSPDQLKNAGVEIGRAEQKNMSSVLKVNGRIDVPPQNIVSISIPLGGYLKSTKLLPGMHVTKGEIIAVMEDQQYIQIQQDFLIAKARFSFAEGEYNRQRELNQNKATSDKLFQQVEADFKSQKILIKSLYEKLKLIGINPDNLDENSLSRSINVYSPISGYVSKVNVNIGKYANPSDVLFEIVNPADIHLALTVFEKDINNLFVGQKVVTYANANPEKRYKCTIILIGRDLSTDRSAVVHCHFEQYDKSLIPGMFMNAEVEIQTKNVLTLPADAVVSFENKHFVFVAMSANEFEMTEVITGTSENGLVEITKGLVANQEYAVKGAYSLLMKMKNTEE